MAAIETLKRSAVNFVVITATDQQTGKQTTRSVALQDVQGSPDIDGIIDIKTALANCLAYPIARAEHTKTVVISEE
ncbi:MAG: hypothetical protein II870_06160 [Synergistaceae bacterium]|nr:hypothetical protein [Synergistaceae bacterium]MBQ6909571.1 hypothetical protein [Synergistaceae bacterium]MBR0043558.1 hypothetical protein [Synergistaceae bacterium]